MQHQSGTEAGTKLELTHRLVRGSGEHAATTLVLLHGTGGDEENLIPLGRALLPGATLLGVRGAVLEHGMPRFFRRVAEGIFDLEDLARRTRQLIEFVHAASVAYRLDPERLIAVGYSNGANIAASVLLTEAGVFSGAVLFRVMLPFEPRQLPALDGAPVLLADGRRDPLIREESARSLAELLGRAGARVTLTFAEAGHELTRADIDAAAVWVREQFPGSGTDLAE